MKIRVLLSILSSLLFVGCTDTAATYREAMNLKKLPISFTHSERDNVSGIEITYTGFQDNDGELRRVLVEAKKNDTLWIDDHYYSNNTAIYYKHTHVFRGDTATSCTYFFQANKCIKRACAFGEPKEEKTAEMAMITTFSKMKDFTR